MSTEKEGKKEKHKTLEKPSKTVLFRDDYDPAKLGLQTLDQFQLENMKVLKLCVINVLLVEKLWISIKIKDMGQPNNIPNNSTIHLYFCVNSVVKRDWVFDFS